MSKLKIGESSVMYYPILNKEYTIPKEKSGVDDNQTISTEFLQRGVKLTYIGTVEKLGKKYNLFVFSKPPRDLSDVSFKGLTGYKNCCGELKNAVQIFEGGKIKGEDEMVIPVAYVKHLTQDDICKTFSIVEDLKNGRVYQRCREGINLADDNYYGRTVNINDLPVDYNEDIISEVQENFGTDILIDGYIAFSEQIKVPRTIKGLNRLFFPENRSYWVAKKGICLEFPEEGIDFGCYLNDGALEIFGVSRLYNTFEGESEEQGCICPIIAVDTIYEDSMEIL